MDVYEEPEVPDNLQPKSRIVSLKKKTTLDYQLPPRDGRCVASLGRCVLVHVCAGTACSEEGTLRRCLRAASLPPLAIPRRNALSVEAAGPRRRTPGSEAREEFERRAERIDQDERLSQRLLSSI
jgi:hypothetical protein